MVTSRARGPFNGKSKPLTSLTPLTEASAPRPPPDLPEKLVPAFRHAAASSMPTAGAAIDVVAGQIAVPPTQMARVEHEVLCAALAQLPFHRREALISIGISGLSCQETAKRSGCPEGTIKSRVNRGRAELAQLLAIEGADDLECDPVMTAATAAGASRALP